MHLEFAQAKMLPFYVLGRNKEEEGRCGHAEKTHINFLNNFYFALFTSAHDVTITTSNAVTQLCFTSQKIRIHDTIK